MEGGESPKSSIEVDGSHWMLDENHRDAYVFSASLPKLQKEREGKANVSEEKLNGSEGKPKEHSPSPSLDTNHREATPRHASDFHSIPRSYTTMYLTCHRRGLTAR